MFGFSNEAMVGMAGIAGVLATIAAAIATKKKPATQVAPTPSPNVTTPQVVAKEEKKDTPTVIVAPTVVANEIQNKKEYRKEDKRDRDNDRNKNDDDNKGKRKK